MNVRDAGSLWDMLQAIKRIQEFTEALSYDDYLNSVLVQSAVERQLEILGEAAGRVSDGLRQSQPAVEWRKIIGLRNILIHQYDEIQKEIVWAVIESDLEMLQKQLKPLMPPLPDEERPLKK